MNKKKSVIFLILISIFLYLALASVAHLRLAHESLIIPTRFAYYNYLLKAFLHGKVYIEGMVANHDLSLHRDKWYLYWGPAPILFILPFYMFWGIQSSDIVYTLVAGIINIYLFFLLIEEFIAYCKLNVSSVSKKIIVAVFAFTSPHLYLTVVAGVWHTNQIIAMFYLLLSYLFYFKFMKNSLKIRNIVISVIFFNLAWFSRYILIFNIFLYFYAIWIHRKNINIAKKIVVVLVSCTFFFFCLYGAYNFFRFGSVRETGHRYQRANLNEFNNQSDKNKATRYVILQKDGQAFSIKYLPHNIVYYFFHHISLDTGRPFVNTNEEGNSVFSVYPFFILIFYLFQKKYLQLSSKRNLLFMTLGLIIVINLMLLLCYVTSGWMQFGNRYFLDVVPLILLLIMVEIENVPYSIQYLLLFYGLFINIFGIFQYFGLF